MPIAAPTFRMEMQFTAGVWTNVTSDVHRNPGVRIRYGIDGNTPTSCCASIGECQFSLKNDARNSGGVVGYYSPLHASVRSGWDFGVVCQVVLSHSSDAATTVTITRSSQTATVAHTSHGKATGEYVTISGANQVEYNGTWQITVTTGNAYTYTVAGSPATPATGTITSRKAYVKHRGKVAVIDPDPNTAGPRTVRVTSYDGMKDLAEADLREVSLLTGATESECFTEILDSVPTDSQPVARSLATGADSFEFVFDDLGSGVKALGVIYDVSASSPFCLAFMKGDGTFTTQSRHTRAALASAFTFNNVMQGLSVPTDRGNVFNCARITIQQRSASDTPIEELYSLSDGSATAPTIPVGGGDTVEVWTPYTDPNDRQTVVGGDDVVTVLIAGTHYSANSAIDGSGTDLTADITATITPFASTAKWSLTNNSGTSGYVRVLKVIGKALRRLGDETYQHPVTTPSNARFLNHAPRYLSDSGIAQGWAALWEDQYNDLNNQISSIDLIANYSTDFMTQVLAREPGDVITVTESVTGLSAVDAVIHGVELEILANTLVRCRFGLAAVPPLGGGFVLDTDQLDVDVLAF